MSNTTHPRARLDAASALAALINAPRDLSVVIVGGGKTGALAAKLALRLGADVTVVDDAPLPKVRAGLKKGGLAHALAVAAPFARAGAGPRARLIAGGIDHDALVGADLVVLSPGVPRAHPAVDAALRAGVPVVNEVELAACVLRSRGVKPRVIGITGTNGKSTTTTMCGAIAKAADLNAFVGGNLGTPYCACALAMLDGAFAQTGAPRFAVLELSSYQLETISTLAFDAAVVTNLTPDHLDRYPSVAAYYAAKARLLALVAPGGGVSLNASDRETAEHLGPLVREGRLPAIARCDFDISNA
ncbi:MAG TPA: Mur ligase family protein, partial [Myxococcota bacterium]